MFNKYMILLIALAIILSGCSPSIMNNLIDNSLEVDEQAEKESYFVKVVKDGDTMDVIEAKTGRTYTVRLLNFDSPESKGKYYNDPMPYGIEAEERLRELVEGKSIVLEEGIGGYDKYGRLLAYGFLPTGESIQEMMLKEGLGVIRYIFDDKKYLTDYKAAMYEAKEQKIGVWSIPNYAEFEKAYNLEVISD